MISDRYRKGCCGLLALAICVLFSATARAEKMTESAGSTAAIPVHEGMFVKIGGIEQWITINGADRTAPAVLILHGGPADAPSPDADSLFAGWDKKFVMVQWDQRGAGRTYGISGPAIEASMSLDRMVQDGIEVSK